MCNSNFGRYLINIKLQRWTVSRSTGLGPRAQHVQQHLLINNPTFATPQSLETMQPELRKSYHK